jgi:hypothetical protein
MDKLALLPVAASLAAVARVAAADTPLTCFFENGEGVLVLKTSASSGLTSLAGSFGVAENQACRNPLCLTEQRPRLVEGMLDGRPIFDRAMQSAIYVGRAVFGERTATLEYSLSSGALKMIFSDGTRDTFVPFFPCTASQ